MPEYLRKLFRFYRKHREAMRDLFIRAGYNPPADEREFYELFKLNPRQVGEIVDTYTKIIEARASMTMQELNSASFDALDIAGVSADSGSSVDSGGFGQASTPPLSQSASLNTATAATHPKINMQSKRFEGNDTLLHALIRNHPNKIRALFRKYRINKPATFASLMDALVVYKAPFADDLYSIYTANFSGAEGDSKGKFLQTLGTIAGAVFGPVGTVVGGLLGMGKGKTPPPPPPPPPPPKKSTDWVPWAVGGGALFVVIILIVVLSGNRSKQ